MITPPERPNGERIPTYYTILADKDRPDTPFYALILTPLGKGYAPSSLYWFKTAEEAHEKTRELYGQNIQFVPPVEFDALLQQRKEQFQTKRT